MFIVIQACHSTRPESVSTYGRYFVSSLSVRAKFGTRLNKRADEFQPRDGECVSSGTAFWALKARRPRWKPLTNQPTETAVMRNPTVVFAPCPSVALEPQRFINICPKPYGPLNPHLGTSCVLLSSNIPVNPAAWTSSQISLAVMAKALPASTQGELKDIES